MATTFAINEDGIEIIRATVSGHAPPADPLPELPEGVGGGMAGQPFGPPPIEEDKEYPARVPDQFDALRLQIRSVIAHSHLPTHHRGMAESKCQELIYWIRAGAGKG